MTTEVYSARVDTDQEEVARQVASYNLLAIPVVDAENKLVGVITVDDVIDVIKDEATEDVYRLAGVSDDDGVLTPPLRVAAAAAALAAGQPRHGVPGGVGRRPVHRTRSRRSSRWPCFMPVVAGMGGNAAHADAGGHRPRHRARRTDLEQRPAGARQGRPGRPGQRRRARRRSPRSAAWALEGQPGARRWSSGWR